MYDLNNTRLLERKKENVKSKNVLFQKLITEILFIQAMTPSLPVVQTITCSLTSVPTATQLPQ